METGRVIGAPVTAARFKAVVDAVMAAATARRAGYVCIANVHMVTTARRQPDLRAAMERAMIVTSDGQPLVWALRRQGLAAERVAGPDLMPALCARAAAEGVPIYLYGGVAPVLDTLAERLTRRYPGLIIAGREAPPMLPPRPPRDDAAIERIRRSGAGLVFVGLGCPKQEFWMDAQSDGVPAVLLGVGAAFDFLAGNQRRAPAWMRAAGLEWLFRLAAEPRRLWRRYLVTNSLFLWYRAVEALGGRRG